MVSLVLRLAWSEQQHGVHRVTQFPVNAPPCIGFYAMGKYIAIALRQFLPFTFDSTSTKKLYPSKRLLFVAINLH